MGISDYYKKIVKSSLVVLSGGSISQIIPFFSIPIVLRLYEVHDYGSFVLFLTYCGVLTIFVNSHYNHAIIIPKEDDEAIKLVSFSSLFAPLFGLLMFVLIGLFDYLNLGLIENLEFRSSLYFLPIAVFIQGWFMAFSNWANRKNKYRRLSISKIILAGITAAIQIIFGFFDPSENWLIVGYFLGFAASTAYLYYGFYKIDGARLSLGGLVLIKSVLNKHIKFLKFTLLTDFKTVLLAALPILMVEFFYSETQEKILETIAFVGLAYNMMALPVRFLSTSIGLVYRQEANLLIVEEKPFADLYKKMLASLSGMALAIYIPIVILGPWIFSLYFGEPYFFAGVFAQIFAVKGLFQLIANPLSYTYLLRNAQKEHFYVHLYLLISTGVIFALGYKYLDLNSSLLIYSINYALSYLFMIVRCYYLSKMEKI